MVEMSDSLLLELLSGDCGPPDVDGNDAISSIGGTGNLFGVVTRRFNDTNTG